MAAGTLALGLALAGTAPVGASRSLDVEANTELVVVSGEATLHLELDELSRRADRHVVTVYVLEEFDGRGRGLTLVSTTEIRGRNQTSTSVDVAVDDFRQDYFVSIEALSKRGKVLNRQFINYRPTCTDYPALSDCAVGELAGFDISTDGSNLSYSADFADGGDPAADERWEITVFEFDREADGPAPILDELVVTRDGVPFDRLVGADTDGLSILYSVTYFQGDERIDGWTGLVPRT